MKTFVFTVSKGKARRMGAVSGLLSAPAPAWALDALDTISRWLLARDWLLPALLLGLLAAVLFSRFRARRSGQAHAYLLARAGGRWHRYPIAGDVVGVGRHPGNAIQITDQSLSRFHAEIVRHGDDTFTITDLGGKNGMRVRYLPVKSASLRDGDLIELGRVRFRFALAPVDKRLFQETQTLEAHRLWPDRERRASPRVAAHGHAILHSDETVTMGEIHDVSDGGLFVKAQAPPAVHTAVEVAVEIEKGHWHTLPGEVVRQTEEGVGIRVVDPAKAEVLRRLRETPPEPASSKPAKM